MEAQLPSQQPEQHSVPSAAAAADDDPAAEEEASTVDDVDAEEAAPELDPEEVAERLQRAEEEKAAGNQHYAAGQWPAARQAYQAALEHAPPSATQRAVYWANIAACDLKEKDYKAAVHHCTQAIEIDDQYLKAVMRRSCAYKELDQLEPALADAQRVLLLDSSNAWAASTVKELEPVVKERQEKMKEEMLGKLKDLGNMVLGKFGMSLDNFKAEKDPATGSYSIKFEN